MQKDYSAEVGRKYRSCLDANGKIGQIKQTCPDKNARPLRVGKILKFLCTDSKYIFVTEKNA